MVKISERFICEICGKNYYSVIMAESCEKRCKEILTGLCTACDKEEKE